MKCLPWASFALAIFIVVPSVVVPGSTLVVVVIPVGPPFSILVGFINALVVSVCKKLLYIVKINTKINY